MTEEYWSTVPRTPRLATPHPDQPRASVASNHVLAATHIAAVTDMLVLLVH